MKYISKWSDRRSAQGSIKPLMYMVIEIISLLMACWFVSVFNFLIVTIIAYLAAFYYVITSVLPRYKKVLKRQKYSQY
jgi:hypothetical protein